MYVKSQRHCFLHRHCLSISQESSTFAKSALDSHRSQPPSSSIITIHQWKVFEDEVIVICWTSNQGEHTVYFSVMGHTGQIGRSKWTIQVTWMNRAIIKSCCIPRHGGKEQFSGKSADLFVCFRLLFTYAMEKFSRHTAQKCEIICGIFKLFLSVDISGALKLIQMLTSLPWHMGLIFKTTFPGQ